MASPSDAIVIKSMVFESTLALFPPIPTNPLVEFAAPPIQI